MCMGLKSFDTLTGLNEWPSLVIRVECTVPECSGELTIAIGCHSLTVSEQPPRSVSMLANCISPHQKEPTLLRRTAFRKWVHAIAALSFFHDHE